MGHIWRVMYPAMEQMPVADWRAYWALVFGKSHDFFSAEGRRRWADKAEAQARAVAAQRGASAVEQEAAAGEAREAVTLMLD